MPRSVAALRVVLHPRCRGLWPRRNTAQAFEDLMENVHSVAYIQTCGAGNGRFVTEDDIFHFFQKRRIPSFFVVNRAILQKKKTDPSLW